MSDHYYVERLQAENADLKDTIAEQAATIERLNADKQRLMLDNASWESTHNAVSAERDSLRQQLASQPAIWLEDSSLETWFPHSAAELAQAREEAENTKRILADGTAVHINMLRGTIAKPSKAQMLHVLGDQSLSTAEADRDSLATQLSEAKQEVLNLNAALTERMKKHGDLRMTICTATNQKYVSDETAISGVRELVAKLTAAESERDAAKADSDWLAMRHVEVREPLVYGSRLLFKAYAESGEEGEDGKPSNLWEQVRAARSTQRVNG